MSSGRSSAILRLLPKCPHINKVDMLEGDRGTARRRLHSRTGYSWTEHCVMWDEGRAYAMEVDSGDGGYPFSKMHRRFEIEEQSDGVVLKMHYAYKAKYGFVGGIWDALFLRRKRQALYEDLLNNWIARIREQKWSYTVTVATVLQSKGHEVIMAGENDSIIEVARILRKNRIGAFWIRSAGRSGVRARYCLGTGRSRAGGPGPAHQRGDVSETRSL